MARCRPSCPLWLRAIVGVVGVVILSVSSPADASDIPPPQLPQNPLHFEPSAATHHRYAWHDDVRDDIRIVFTTDVPTGEFRDRIVEAAAEWNAIGAVSITHDPARDADIAPITPWHDCDQIPDRVILVSYEQRDEAAFLGPLASAGPCTRPGGGLSLYAARMIFDAEELWYTGEAPVTLPPGLYDLQGVATHELGHAVGFLGHFDIHAGVPLFPWFYFHTECTPTELTYHTMCEMAPAATTWMRTLEWNDKKIHQDAYGI